VLCLLSVSTQSTIAIDCSAKCPSWPLGVVAGQDSMIIVSPPTIPAKFTGCQIAWDSNYTKRMTIEFELGILKKVEALNKEKKYSICHYQTGKPVKGAAPVCVVLMEQLSHFRGIDSVPVKQDQVNWPDNKCFPELK